MEQGKCAGPSRRRPIARWFALALLVTVIGCSHDAAREASLEPIARISFSVEESGLPTFSARVNGDPVQLFIDTGGYKPIALKQDVIRRLSLPYDDGSSSANDAQGQSYTARSFTATSFQAGSLSLSPAHGADLPNLGTHAYPQDGYLGYGVLKNHTLVIDYARGELLMYAPSAGSAVLARECGVDTFDFEIRNAVIQATVETDVGPRIFQFDTGANRNIVRQAPATGAAEATFKRFHLGTAELGPMSFRVIPYRAPDVDGVLGKDFFAAHRVCLDLDAGKGAIR